ncbi:MAG: tRNA pseudouridine(54/55) synthase Pus10 [Candidatus Aenigmarchaeota archaeon]|nr:tRNA pseudouridine(54/55) synthase Pus10 [Candidatus Aenigmarchaeota archaeon]
MKNAKEIMSLALKIFETGDVCDSCLGRQFTRVIRAADNSERGRKIRTMIGKDGRALPADHKDASCPLCENTIAGIRTTASDIVKKIKPAGFSTFMIGVRMSDSLVMKEEALWGKIGIKYCEPLKTEIARELGKLIVHKTGKKQDTEHPNIIITFDVQKMSAEIFYNPLFIYGEYKKLVRGLPQTSSRQFKDSVEDIIARPLMKVTKSREHVLHAQGREDRDARCLAWRPFIVELKQPLMRKLPLKKMESAINKSAKVRVARLRLSTRKKVAELKAQNPFKVYRVVVDFETPVEKPERLKGIVGAIKQRTPNRILGAKPDKTKHKKVKNIKWKRINTKRYQFDITAESGLYLQELITGDGGRTKPSISQLLENQAHMKEFDLIGIKKG